MRSSELVFGVKGSVALGAQTITLAEAGLKERQHLQEWVLANPAILGEDVTVITSEFDKWVSKEGRELDRLDILGLGADGRLVVAELKRDTAPDFVARQAIKYAAMASRFDLDQLAKAYIDFHAGEEDAPTTTDEALAVLSEHAPELSADTVKNPRLVIIAGDFPTTLTSSVVWLSERGLDLTLIRVQAYLLGGQHIVTVSQVWPTPDVEEFVVAPSRTERTAKQSVTVPVVPWTQDDLDRLAGTVTSPTILAALDLCAQRPGTWIGGNEIMTVTGRAKSVHRGDFGGFAVTLQRKFDRSNTPYESEYDEGDGVWQQWYRLDDETASMWRAVRALALNPGPAPVPPTAAGSDDTEEHHDHP